MENKKKINKVVKTTAEITNGLYNKVINQNAEYAERRYQICLQCNFFNKENKTCRKCGCNMRVKVYSKISNCPMGYWTKEE